MAFGALIKSLPLEGKVDFQQFIAEKTDEVFCKNPSSTLADAMVPLLLRGGESIIHADGGFQPAFFARPFLF